LLLYRWGNPGFADYVSVLASHADEALALTPELMTKAKEIVEKVADLEVDFWSMAYNEEGAK
jgi:thiaminase